MAEPDPRVHRLPADRSALDPAPVVCLDDSAVDVAAAPAGGFAGVLVTSARSARAALAARGASV